MNNKKKSKTLYTPWREFISFGVKKAFLSPWPIGSLYVGFACCWVPIEGNTVLSAIFASHLMLLGVAVTVFGFTILGGKDDFYQTILVDDKDESGFLALRHLVLFLFWPIPLHAIALALCLGCLALGTSLTGRPWHLLAWRWLYGFVASWAVLQSFFSVRQLYHLAIVRLMIKRNNIKEEENKHSAVAQPNANDEDESKQEY